jgi:phage-related protein
MKDKEIVAYCGDYFTKEWYFDSKGKSQPLDYFYAMNNLQKRKLLVLFKRIDDFGKISDKTKFRNEKDGIYAFKPQPDRLLAFFTKDKKIIITEGFYKKSEKLPQNIKDRSIKIRKDYLTRVMEGSYYE